MRRILSAGAVAALGAVLAAGAASAQSLGSQRVATSAATYLKIGLGPRAIAMGGAFVAVADDPMSVVWNPAGLAYITHPAVQASAMRWPTGIDFDHVVGARSLNGGAGGTVAAQIGSLRADIEETTEYDPLGTGRTFTYADWFAGVAYGRLFTDRLAIGVGARLLGEDLASDLGGTSAIDASFDFGSIYAIGWRHVRMGMSVTNFGPPLKPRGRFTESDGTQVDYGSYALPTVFRFGIADEAIEREGLRLTWDFELNHPADAVEGFRGGAELLVRNQLALRGGYDFASDAGGFAVGAGFRGQLGSVYALIDYAYKDGADLGATHAVSLGVGF